MMPDLDIPLMNHREKHFVIPGQTATSDYFSAC
jgi:hypothetical protein